MWNNIIGQQRSVEILKNIFLSGKISHAYIFYGNEGTGKDAAAIEFAKLLNCDSPVNENEACDKCKYCLEIDSFKSPLFKYVIALPTGKSESDEDFNPLEKLEKEDFENYLNEIESKASDKYHKISLPRANEIRISSIRQMKRDIYLTGRTGKKKVFIISKADMMNAQSANSLLKILEEPPKDSVLILTASRIDSLLPTIIGRCQKIKFNQLTSDDFKFYFHKHGINETDIDLYTALSEGSITKLNQVLGGNYLELRDKVIEVLRAVLSDNRLKLSNAIDGVVSKKDKERVKQFLLLMIIWFRDIIHKSNGNDEYIINQDSEKTEILNKFIKKFDSENYKIINSIEDAYRDVDSNVFTDMMLLNLSNKIRSYIRNKD
ncbi:MAG: hypothetical protein ABI528_01250 [bacterium]